MQSPLEFLFPFLLRRRLAKERVAAIKAEVLVDNEQDATWIVYQLGGRVRYVADRLFARDGDIAVKKGSDSIMHPSRYAGGVIRALSEKEITGIGA